jgi:hypothetical protein
MALQILNTIMNTRKTFRMFLFYGSDKFTHIISFDKAYDKLSFGSYNKLISWFDAKMSTRF